MNEKPTQLSAGMDHVRRVLVTGFEPFGDHRTNISQRVVDRMGGQHVLHHPWADETFPVHVEVDVLPVDVHGAQRTAQRLREGSTWDAILHVGLCESCDVPRLERIARDRLDMRIPDNLGRQVNNTNLDGLGPRGCWLDLTLWNPAAFPVPYSISTDAGAYLCNETYHASLKATCESPSTSPVPPPVLFLHLPGEARLTVDQGVRFVEACLAHMLHPFPMDPVHVVAGCFSSPTGEVLVAQRAIGEVEGGRWEFPGGKCEPLEPWSMALEREIEEELQLKVRSDHPLGSWYRQHDGAAFVIHLIRARLDANAGAPSLSVHQAVDWVEADATSQLAWAGRDDEMLDFIGQIIKSTS